MDSAQWFLVIALTTLAVTSALVTLIAIVFS
jgi:hypothetical protein